MEEQNVVDPRDRGDGGPFGTEACVWVLVGERPARVLPSRAVGSSVKDWVRAPIVRDEPGALFGVAMLSEEVFLNLDQEVVVGFLG